MQRIYQEETPERKWTRSQRGRERARCRPDSWWNREGGRLGGSLLDHSAILKVHRSHWGALKQASCQRRPCLPGMVTLRIPGTLSHWLKVSLRSTDGTITGTSILMRKPRAVGEARSLWSVVGKVHSRRPPQETDSSLPKYQWKD